MMRGLDYAWANPKPSPACLQSAGAAFIMRYFSNDPSKDLTKTELDAAVAAGMTVGVVWETTANRMLSGHGGGVTDAAESDKRANSLAIPGIPVYFACDWDAAESQQPAINAYLDGAASVIGRPRVGMYAGYHPLKRAWDTGRITYGWQTYAWSGGLWDNRAQLRQVQNGVTVCGTDADWDEALAEDFGQWPRPGSVPVPPPAGWTEQIVKQLTTVQQGMTGEAVRTAQGALTARHELIVVDGIFGPATDAAVRHQQGLAHLAVDGIVGQQTWPVILGVA